MVSYDIRSGVKKIKTKTALLISGATLGFAGLAMAIAMPLGAKAVAGGPVCDVPTDYATIQAAVNVPTCTTINVAPGLYPENVVIDHTLTLNGAQAGNPVSARSAASLAESTVSGVANGTAVISIRAADVRVDGFSITDSRTAFAAYGVGVKTTGNNAVITNNIMDTIVTTDTSANGTAQAVYLEGGPDGVSILNNQMSNITSDRSAKGVLLGDNGATNAPNNTTVQGNSMSNITSTSRGAYAVNLANITVGTSGLQILNNTISSLTGTGWVHAIGIEGNAPSVSITGNSISTLSGPTSDTIAVWFENEDTSFATGQVHNNNFNVAAPIYGIAVHPLLTGGSVSGTCNYWNSSTGPTAVSNPGGTGAQVSANVTYNPWLLSANGSCANGPIVTNKDDCKNGGWQGLTDGTKAFKNQGDCVSFVATGGKNPAAGPKQH